MKTNPVKPYMNPYIAGALLGIVIFFAFFMTGNGIGASGGLNKLIIAVEAFFFSEHVLKVPYLAESIDRQNGTLNHYLVWEVLGVLAGGFFSGFLSGRNRREINKGPGISNTKRLFFAFIGGAIMGYGARFARGCTSGQALSGGAVLSAGSWAFMFSVFAGAYFLAFFVRKLWL